MNEDALLKRLDTIVRRNTAVRLIEDSILRLEAKLALNPKDLFAWDTIPLSVFPDSVPAEIKSCWVFLIRAGIPPDKHRHPNSIQRTVAWRGSGDLQVAKGQRFTSNVLETNRDLPLNRRWVSIPANSWHRPVVTSDWVVVSFHEVPAEELIEEASEGRKSRKYVW
jgi:hypothetical protein